MDKRTLANKTPELVGKSVLLKGWVDSKRDHGKITFIDLRDRSGLVQVVGAKELSKLGSEDVVAIEGAVKKRPENLINPKLSTGKVEIEAKKVTLLNQSKELPLPIDTDGHDIEESVRLKYRYLDLRRPRLQKNIKNRSKLVQEFRRYLFTQDFTEIETPLLTKSTPEGSRDFLVPSRLQPGKFYALPQSPQQYKQLLMVAGFERYFQIARAVRDEDLRADRGFEHSQVDIEMSFVDQLAVMSLVEDAVIHSVEASGGNILKKPFPVIPYKQTIKKYGDDKFDMRSSKEKETGKLAFAWVVDFPFFERTPEGDWTFTHNPFSMPQKEHIRDLLHKRNIDKILTTQYDLVCNGFEVGGGSIRSNKPEILEKVFEIIGHSQENIQNQFGHMLEAFSFGAPPHGGIALGIERLAMILSGEKYLREVQAFPQTGSGHTSIMDAPSAVDPLQLKELGISLASAAKGSSKSVFEQIKSKLDSLNINFQVVKHEPVLTSEEAAKARGTKIEQGAKALIMYADKQPIMVVLSAATKVDTKAFKKAFSVKDLRMATAEEVVKVTGVKVGAVPPFGSIQEIKTYLDDKLSKNSTIVFNAGHHDRSITMSYSDYLRAEQPQFGKFSTSG